MNRGETRKGKKDKRTNGSIKKERS